MKIITSSALLLTIWRSAAILATVAYPGAVQHHHQIEEKEDSHHHHHPQYKATSYQSIELEHFHAVPTYVKKGDAHLLKHPVHKGKTSAAVQVHHGHKHDPGHAITNIHSSAHDAIEHEVSYEPIEYKHDVVPHQHHSEPEQESPHHHHPMVAHGGQSEAGAEYTQAHAAAVALVDGSQRVSGGGHGEEEYKNSYGHHYHQTQARVADEKEAAVAEGEEGKQTAAYYQHQPQQVQNAGAYQEEHAPKEYQYISQQQKSQQADALRHHH